ncbi:hypothetical protein HI914_00435 [Erysiphe necator]|nr:hypothetical protein HI914_00435 [Erysiphe necator]
MSQMYSSSTPPPALAEEGPLALSPVISSSSTAEEEEVAVSPALPPLPEPKFNGHVVKVPSPRTPLPVSVSEQADYFTASWGSPYQTSTSIQLGYNHSEATSSEEDSVEVPFHNFQLHTPFLRPATLLTRAHTDPEILIQDRITSATVLANRARRKRLGLTEDWIRKHTCGEQAESNNWLSDGEQSDTYSFTGSRLSSDTYLFFGEENPETPTLESYFEPHGSQSFKRVHKRRLSATTLRQEDFYSNQEPCKSKQYSPNTKKRVMDISNKPIPATSSEEWRAAALPSPTELPASITAPPVDLRTKKKIPWNGKYILVLLPKDEAREKEDQKPYPMTETDVMNMLESWEKLGYNTKGFNLGTEYSEDVESAQGQSRKIWPLAQDILDEKNRGLLKVRIPDQREWDKYVQELKEAKLRSLGVSLSDDEPAPQPFALTAISNLNRRASIQYPPVSFSPPIPTSSAGSSHINLGHNPFSPIVMPPGASMATNQSSHPASVASPLSLNDINQGKYNLYHSNSYTANDRPFGSPFQFSHQQSPISWSPGQLFHQQGLGSGGRSPPKSNFGPILSPLISFSPEIGLPQTTDIKSQLQQRQNILQTQLPHSQLQLGINQISSRLEGVKEHDDEDRNIVKKDLSKTVRGSKSISLETQSLQEEIEAAEYHLESQIQRELEHEDYSPHSEIGNELILHHPQPHSRKHSLFKDKDDNPIDLSNIRPLDNCAEQSDTQRIITGKFASFSPTKAIKTVHDQAKADGESILNENSSPKSYGTSAKLAQDTLNHKPKASFSKLNVTAKEFTFNPSSISTMTTATSMSDLSRQQGSSLSLHFRSQGSKGAQPAFSESAPLVTASTSQLGHISENFHHGQLNYNPTFVPGNSEFNFSSTPIFRRNSIAYNFPGSNTMTTGINTHQIPIFGNRDLHKIGIEKPGKISKAIPIVRPDETKVAGHPKRIRGNVDNFNSAHALAEPVEPIQEVDTSQPTEKNIPSSDIPLNKEISLFSPTNQKPKDPKEERKHKAPSWSFPKQPEISDIADVKMSKANEPDRPTSQTSISTTSRGIFQTIKENFKYLGHKRNSSSMSMTAKSIETESNNPLLQKKTSSASMNKTSSPSKSQIKVSQDFPAKPVPTQNKQHNNRLTSLSESISTQNITSTQVKDPISNDNEKKEGIISGSSPMIKALKLAHTDLTNIKSLNNSLQNNEERASKNNFEEGETYSRNDNETEISLPRNEKGGLKSHHPSPARCIKVPDLDSSSPLRFLPNNIRSDAPSPSPKRFRTLPGETNIFTRDREDLFKFESQRTLTYNIDGEPTSEWDDVITDAEESKIKPRAQFFDNHVNNIISGILAERLNPLEQTLGLIQESIVTIADQILVPQDPTSTVGEFSDADDEDDDDSPRLTVNLRRDKRLNQIKAIIQESIGSINPGGSQPAMSDNHVDLQNMTQALQEIKNQLNQPTKIDFSSPGLRDIIKETIERKMPNKLLLADGVNVTRIADLQSKLSQAESRMDEEIQIRRAAEDRLSEIQRQLRISSEEEHRLRAELEQRETKIRNILDDCDAKVRSLEVDHAKSLMRITILEAADDHTKKNEASLQFKIQKLEDDLFTSQQQNEKLKMENEHAQEVSRRYSENVEQITLTNKELRHTIERLKIQSEESIRVREVMRGKLIALQEDMARAASEITDENSRRAKKEQELICRQEVLDARLQAEARTRERMEAEIERLERGERDALRAINEFRNLEDLVTKLTEDNVTSKKDAQRCQLELASANDQIIIMRENFEGQVRNLRSDIDYARLDTQNIRTTNEKLLEDIEISKKNFEKNFAEREEYLETQHSRQIHIITEEAQRQEHHLLERLSLSKDKNQQLEDRVALLEEKLEIANTAAAAAANAAKTARSESNTSIKSKKLKSNDDSNTAGIENPEKISSQALRETIISLQEQLQDREITIESLESTLSCIDPDIEIKISKRDDEIMWLRELLAVRKSDLTEIVQCLEQDCWDVERVKDAAIRLRANLQMQEQELERAINGGSALPNLAASLKDVASPRVAQAVSPLVAALGSWRKSKTDGSRGSYMNIGSGLTPSKNDLRPISGILTPPNSVGQQQTKPAPKFKVLNSNNQRFSSEQLANRPRVAVWGMPPKKVGDLRAQGSFNCSEKESERNSHDPLPIMMESSYDQDATEEEFNKAGFHLSKEDCNDSVLELCHKS